MTFTGTLIEDLMATVERAEHRAENRSDYRVERLTENRSDDLLGKRAPSDAAFLAAPAPVEATLAEESIAEAWFASVRDNRDYDARSLGVA